MRAASVWPKFAWAHGFKLNAASAKAWAENEYRRPS
jgi:hypothetical protein